MIDDEMPIQHNKVKDNVKPQQEAANSRAVLDMQGLINNFIQPEIYKSLQQQFLNSSIDGSGG